MLYIAKDSLDSEPQKGVLWSDPPKPLTACCLSLLLHRTNDVAALLSAGVKDGWVGIPTVHQNISARIIRERADDIQSHIDLRAILRTAAFQAIA